MDKPHLRYVLLIGVLLGLAVTAPLLLASIGDESETGENESSDTDTTLAADAGGEVTTDTETGSQTPGTDMARAEPECVDGIPVGHDVGEGTNVEGDERYVNMFRPRTRPNWIPEEEVSLENPKAHTYEVTRMPNASPTRSDLESAWELYKRSYQTAKQKRWFDLERAKEDGFRQSHGMHYINLENTFLRTNESLEPERPETLMYVVDPDSGEKILAGFMYSNLKREGEQLAGPLALWHYHPAGDPTQGRIKEFVDGDTRVEVEDIRDAWRDPEGGLRRLEMVHVWFLRHPEGPFASSMEVPSVISEPEMMSECEFKTYLLDSYESYFAPR